MLIKRVTAAVASGFVVILAVPTIAFADPDFFGGQVECGAGGGPGCDVTASSGTEGTTSPDRPPQAGTEPAQGSADGSSRPAEADCDTESYTASCSITVTAGGGGGDEPVEEVDVEALAHEARASLNLPTPQVSMSPSADAPILVRVPVWMWISSEDWQPQTATASVPGGSVTVTAAPTSVDWEMGDGGSVSCDGSGTAYNPRVHEPDAESPDCGHTYTATGEREVTASLSWEVEWSSTDDEGGGLPPLTTSSSAQVQVIESSGVVT